jgi:hypothetical protein
MLRTSHKRFSEIAIAGLGDAQLRIVLTRLRTSWPKSEVAAHIPALGESRGTSECEDVAQRGERAYAIDPQQNQRLRIFGIRELLDERVILLDLPGQRCDLAQRRSENLGNSRPANRSGNAPQKYPHHSKEAGSPDS